jgi:hypothetical protein
MEEKLRIYDNRDRVIIELKQTLWDLCLFIIVIIAFMQILWELCQSDILLLFLLTFIFSIVAHAIFSSIFASIELGWVSPRTILMWLLLIFRLFCRNTSITINRSSKKIIVKSHYQIATLNFGFSERHLSYVSDTTADSEYENNKNSNSVTKVIAEIVSGIAQVRYSETSETLERLLTKILSSATDMEFTESEADFTLKDNDTPRDSHSPLVVNTLDTLHYENFSVENIEDQLIFIYKIPCKVSISLGVFLLGLGLFCIYLVSRWSPSWSLYLVAISLAIFPIVLLFRGVYILVKRFLTVISYKVYLDKMSGLAILEEQFPFYRASSAYLLENVELTIEKSQNPEDYLNDHQVLLITLKKAEHPSRRVVLYEHYDNKFLCELRDCIMEFIGV